ncbi:uncharacterized protein LOC111519071 isoform X3 [Drosophila willistoni]|uniref:uncharacterized protein LOC111519071 isoform X3 n=1 Tax=Drosophila willistoni TaxID=7260 RepID=UPI001F07E6F3|nr:uncharacterized protein LOC111519071 isoform X3 [Drosophila willistoni]
MQCRDVDNCDRPNWMIPWLVFTWIGVICYSNCLALVIDANVSLLVAMVISIVNWAIVMQVFLNLKNWTRQENRETINNENTANFQSTSAN